jgi:hypothetical protein
MALLSWEAVDVVLLKVGADQVVQPLFIRVRIKLLYERFSLREFNELPNIRPKSPLADRCKPLL